MTASFPTPHGQVVVEVTPFGTISRQAWWTLCRALGATEAQFVLKARGLEVAP
jgi:hypothetical protein